MKKIWLLGDNFLAETYCKYFKKAGPDFYMKENYDVTAFCSSKYSDKNTNAVSRVLNSLILAVNQKVILPDYLINCLEADLIEYLGYKKYGVSTLYGSWIEFLSKEISEILDARRQGLPIGSHLKNKPQISWVEPVRHANFDFVDGQMRDKFGACLNAVSKIYENMRCLKIRNPWDRNDSNLCDYQGRIADFLENPG